MGASFAWWRSLLCFGRKDIEVSKVEGEIKNNGFGFRLRRGQHSEIKKIWIFLRGHWYYVVSVATKRNCATVVPVDLARYYKVSKLDLHVVKCAKMNQSINPTCMYPRKEQKVN